MATEGPWPSIGAHVQAGKIPADYDEGILLEVLEGGQALVAWNRSLERTWQHISTLEPYDPEIDARLHDGDI